MDVRDEIRLKEIARTFVSGKCFSELCIFSFNLKPGNKGTWLFK